MTILVIGWESFGLAYIVETFIEAGYIVDFFNYPIRMEDMRHNPQMGEKLVKKIAEDKYDFVFSTNYFPVVSLACNACRIKYVSWTYDSPNVALYSRTISYPYNYAFIFDKETYLDLKRRGAETVYYLPMAAPVEIYDGMIPTEEQKTKYTTDIAFVGSTYNEKKNQLYNLTEGVSEFAKGYMDGIIQAQKRIYGKFIIDKMLTPVIPELESACPVPLYPDDTRTQEWYYARYILARKITAIEREEVLNMLAERYQVHLYTHSQTPELINVINQGSANNMREAILVYKCAKINLNVTLRSIVTGIPLRIMEIMGSGGFVLSNYQEDVLEHFVPGEDIVLYSDYEDLMRKADYYLTHEEERKQIARNGYEKVKKYHTYQKRIEEILQIIND
ncbi:spore maturation protein CgeB [Kineothrix alysoides]|uniref:Spore maturation protein CgeB n=1 Tax=Kineothrix alysoides TaxID=1469948 RepID=A0A4V2QAZ7_9FIRM|nr:glycosyltransferase [Kineothrix alysoides]TCL54022.1 spore maturation protein CgeB [Kineothrix alysoides]